MERSDREAFRLDYYYRAYGRTAVTLYRRRALERFGEGFFSEENNFGTPFAPVGTGEGGDHWRTEAHPCFWEFVQLIKTM